MQNFLDSGFLQGDVTRDDSQRRFLAQQSVATLLRHCFEWLQHCSNVATLCCAKNRRCESSRVTSPLRGATQRLLVQNELKDDWVIDTSDDLLLRRR